MAATLHYLLNKTTQQKLAIWIVKKSLIIPTFAQQQKSLIIPTFALVNNTYVVVIFIVRKH